MNADAYLARVDAALRDLPWRMRRQLLSELRSHLSELPPEQAAQLGTPEQYAADLRAAAGLERRRGAVAFLRARHPRNLIAAVVLLTATGLTIGAVVWINSYQPLAYSFGTQLPAHWKPAPGQPGAEVVFRKGRPFRYGITIQNTGRFTVRVLDVQKDVLNFYAGHLLMSEAKNRSPDERPLVRFQPFDLKPGEIRWLVFNGVYACTTGAGPGLGITWVAVPVRFSFLWRTATAWIDLRDPLSYVFPKGCPPARAGPATP